MHDDAKNTVKASARELIAAGFALCRIRAGEKLPSDGGWPLNPISNPAAFHPGDGVGIIAGPLSGGLVTVDLDLGADDADAWTAADEILPPTPCMDGRPGKLTAHRHYRLTDTTWADEHLPLSGLVRSAMDDGRLPRFCGIRHLSDGSGRCLDFIGAGGQCVVPPSPHHSGVNRAWSAGRLVEPARIDFATLFAAVERLAARLGMHGRKPPAPALPVDRAVLDRVPADRRARRLHQYLLSAPALRHRAGEGYHAQQYRVCMTACEFGVEYADALPLVVAWDSTSATPDGERIMADTLSRAYERGSFGSKVAASAEPALVDSTPVENAESDGLVVLSADAVQPEDVRWLVPLWLAAGALSLVAGDPGVGKSFLSCEVAARASRGQPVLGQRISGPLRVLLVNLEDHPGMVQRPRLEACGADLGNVLLLQEVRIGGKPAPVAVPRDVDLIERLVVQRGLSLVILDPISAMLSGVELNDMAQVRGALAPLEGMARRTGCAVLLIHHNRKAAAGSAQHRVGGSVAFTAAARTVWSVTVDGTDATRRLVHVSKSNLGKHPAGHAYTIDGEPGRVLWLGETAGSADDAAVAAGLDDGDREGVAWLREVLHRGPVPASEVQREAKAAGVDARRLRQLGKRHLGMVCRKHGFDGPWLWSLPLPPHAASSDSSQKHGASSAESGDDCGFFVETPKKHEEAETGSQEAGKNDEEAPSISQEYEEVVISLRGS